jgi:hypothetical protein
MVYRRFWNTPKSRTNLRDKAPEYALYMLNRQAVKNVTMPLIPGEMKLTVVDASTLQVARRGESGWRLPSRLPLD